MVNALLLIGAVPLGFLHASKLDPDLGLPGAPHTHASPDMNWRALLERLGTPQLPDIILSSSQHNPNRGKHKPDILLADPSSVTAADANMPSEVKVEVPSSSSSGANQEAMKARSSEGRLPLAHWLREALSVLRHKQDEDKEEEEEEEEEERDGIVGSEEWREAGALLRKIGDLLDGCTWSGRGRVTSSALGFPLARPLACCCCCCCCLAASVLGLLTWQLLLWCR